MLTHMPLWSSVYPALHAAEPIRLTQMVGSDVQMRNLSSYRQLACTRASLHGAGRTTKVQALLHHVNDFDQILSYREGLFAACSHARQRLDAQ